MRIGNLESLKDQNNVFNFLVMNAAHEMTTSLIEEFVQAAGNLPTWMDVVIQDDKNWREWVIKGLPLSGGNDVTYETFTGLLREVKLHAEILAERNPGMEFRVFMATDSFVASKVVHKEL